MENEFFMNTGLPPQPPLSHFDSLSSPALLNWPSSSSSPDFAYWEKPAEQSIFDSALSSLVSSPAASNSNISGDSLVIGELIGKLGNIGSNSGDAIGGFPNSSSCYSTPLSSPPAMGFHNRTPPPMSSPVADLAADPGFAERAARFSRFGSRSFNERTSQFVMKTNEQNPCFSNRSNVETAERLPRVSSSPSLKAVGSQPLNNSIKGSAEDSGKLGSELCRKRKSVPRGKMKENAVSSSPSPNSDKGADGNEDSDSKRSKLGSENVKEGGSMKTGEESKSNNEKQSKKPPEPPKDYIHVRARRGQATDSHSLAERVRREKISERMKLLQDLVPGCNKVTGKALMLDEIINYVQSLQRQVEFLSMKLASVNTRLDFNVDRPLSKDIIQGNNPMQRAIFLGDSPAQQAILGQNSMLHGNIPTGGAVSRCAVDPQNPPFLTTLPPLHFSDTNPQFPASCEDDLQSIVQMGFGQNPSRDPGVLNSQSFNGSNPVSHMKIEL